MVSREDGGWEDGFAPKPDSRDFKMTLKHKLRRFVQKRVGLDITRYPLHNLLARTVQMLDHYGVNCVVDVGANDGAFASSIREVGYTGRIISYEPLSKPFGALRRRAEADDNWDVYQYAIGATRDTVTINVSGNAGLSSSVLPMLDTHSSAAPNSRYIDSEKVNQDRLDSLIPGLGVSSDHRTFIKIDVQGYEAAVLDGASDLLDGKGVIGLQLELSLAPLYEGAMTYREGLDRAEALGMRLMGLGPVFTDPITGRLLQIDGVFFRE
jgi:FkbM family methyltransferase